MKELSKKELSNVAPASTQTRHCKHGKAIHRINYQVVNTPAFLVHLCRSLVLNLFKAATPIDSYFCLQHTYLFVTWLIWVILLKQMHCLELENE
jgi:hypothetical protein